MICNFPSSVLCKSYDLKTMRNSVISMLLGSINIYIYVPLSRSSILTISQYQRKFEVLMFAESRITVYVTGANSWTGTSVADALLERQNEYVRTSHHFLFNAYADFKVPRKSLPQFAHLQQTSLWSHLCVHEVQKFVLSSLLL